MAQMVKILSLQYRRPKFDPWVRKTPWRRECLPTPVFLPGEFHGQRSLVRYIQSMGSQRIGHDWATFTFKKGSIEENNSTVNHGYMWIVWFQMILISFNILFCIIQIFINKWYITFIIWKYILFLKWNKKLFSKNGKVIMLIKI